MQWGGLPGGPVDVLTVYPQHGIVMAAACHSQIPSWGSFTSVCLLLSLPWFVLLSFSPSSYWLQCLPFSPYIHPTNSSVLSLFLPFLSSFMKTELERKLAPAMLFVSLHIQTSFCALEFLKRLRIKAEISSILSDAISGLCNELLERANLVNDFFLMSFST